MVEVAKDFYTKRLYLRMPELEDAPSIFREYATDVEVTKYLSWKPHQTLSDTEQFLSMQLSLWEHGNSYAWVIINRTDNNLIGMIDLRINGFNAECGYVLGRSRWGQGYMTEALIAVRNLAFTIPTIERFQIVCDVENLASARVMEKSGFQREGVLRRYFLYPNMDNIPRDCLCYSCIR